jgi:hypothetical protein
VKKWTTIMQFLTQLPTLPEKSYSLKIQIKYKHGKLDMAAELYNRTATVE